MSQLTKNRKLPIKWIALAFVVIAGIAICRKSPTVTTVKTGNTLASTLDVLTANYGNRGIVFAGTTTDAGRIIIEARGDVFDTMADTELRNTMSCVMKMVKARHGDRHHEVEVYGSTRRLGKIDHGFGGMVVKTY